MLNLKKNWNLLARPALWLSGTLGTFVWPPPRDLTAADTFSTTGLVRFLIAILLGFFVLLTTKSTSGTHARWWAAASLGATLAFLASVFVYQDNAKEKTVNYDGIQVVIGSIYTPMGQQYVEKRKAATAADMVLDSAGRPDLIWTQDSLRRNARQLTLLYIVSMVTGASAIMSLLQAIELSQKRARRRKSPAGARG